MLTFAQVVVAYEQRRELDRALTSILSQSVLPDRVIVGDDASEDGTRELIEEYAGAHPDLIRPVLADRNQGVSANRNRCIRAAEADYVSFLDADDYLLPGKFEAQVPLVERAHPDFRFFYSGYRLERENGEDEAVSAGRTGDCFGDLARRRLPARNWWVDRSLLEQIGGFDESLPLYEDWKMKLEIALRTPWRFCPGLYSVYRVHGQGLHNRRMEDHLRTIRQIEEDLTERYPLSSRQRRYLRATRHYYEAKAADAWPERIAGALGAAVRDPVRWLPRMARWSARQIFDRGSE